MATFESYKEIISALEQLSTDIESGKLNENDLQRFVDLSQKLYERAVILNFKAMEAKVFEGKNNAEVEIEEPVVQPPKAAPAVIENKPKEEPSILFDFSTEQEDSVEAEDAEEEVPTPVETVKEVETSKTETIIEQQVTTITNDEVQSFYQRFTKVHNDSLNDQLSNAKIESLKSAFGLNDKMRIIAELFDGESDAFSSTISELDQLNSGEVARKRLSEIAASRHWDAENDLVEEFVKTVDRKFD
jgi:hypothetical protein